MTPGRKTDHKRDRPRDVIFEFSAVGNSVKVCAVDARSGLEVSIVGPVNAGEAALRRAALDKLEYMMDKRSPGPMGSNGTFA